MININTKSSYYIGILLIVSILLFFSSIGFKQLWRTDETRVAGISASMFHDDNYLMPKLNGKPFLEYPPLYYWTTAYSYKLFGKSLFASRLSSAMAATVTVLLIFLLARLFGMTTFSSFLSGVLIATCGQFWSVANRCLVDMVLCMFVTISMVSFYSIHISLENREGFFKNIYKIIILILSLGCGILTKSLIGLAIPTCAIFFWLLTCLYFDKKIYIKSWIVLIVSSVLSLIPPGIWLYMLYVKYGVNAAKTAALVNTFDRFSGEYAQHVNPIYYYLGKIPTQFLPWTVILVLIILAMIYFKKKVQLNKSFRFVLCWIIFLLIFFSISEGKRSVYLLPLYPAFAIITVMLFDNILETISKFKNYNYQKIMLYLSMFIVLVLFVAGLIIAFAFNKKYTFYPIFTYYNKHKNIKEDALYLYSPDEAMRGAVNYYLGKNIPVITEDELKSIITDNAGKLCLITPKELDLGTNFDVKKFDIKRDKWYLIYSKN